MRRERRAESLKRKLKATVATWRDFNPTWTILVGLSPRVEASITDHLRDFAPDVEKYEVVQFFPK